ncbi:EamA family transporter, partial [Aeromonas rivipollensis]
GAQPTLNERTLVGCTPMLAGMLISQIRLRWWWKSRRDKVPSQP